MKNNNSDDSNADCSFTTFAQHSGGDHKHGSPWWNS